MPQDDKLAERQREYDEALAYLRSLGLPEDQWIFKDTREWWKISGLEPRLNLSGEAIRQQLLDALKTDEREGMPGGVMHSAQSGWSVARRGVVVYLARLRRSQRERATG